VAILLFSVTFLTILGARPYTAVTTPLAHGGCGKNADSRQRRLDWPLYEHCAQASASVSYPLLMTILILYLTFLVNNKYHTLHIIFKRLVCLGYVSRYLV
jgi:hypothetical protein